MSHENEYIQLTDGKSTKTVTRRAFELMGKNKNGFYPVGQEKAAADNSKVDNALKAQQAAARARGLYKDGNLEDALKEFKKAAELDDSEVNQQTVKNVQAELDAAKASEQGGSTEEVNTLTPLLDGLHHARKAKVLKADGLIEAENYEEAYNVLNELSEVLEGELQDRNASLIELVEGKLEAGE